MREIYLLIHLLGTIMILLKLNLKLKKYSKDGTATVLNHLTNRTASVKVGILNHRNKPLHLLHQLQDQMTVTHLTEIPRINLADQMKGEDGSRKIWTEITLILMTEDLTTETEALETEEVFKMKMTMTTGGGEMMTDQEDDHQKEAGDLLKLLSQPETGEWRGN